MTVPTFIGRSFDQICFAVPDLEEAVEYWTRHHGVSRWSIHHDLARTQIEKTYWGEPGDFEFSCAYAYAGDTLIELAQHDEGRSVYGDWVDAGLKGPHHIGFQLPDLAEYGEARAHYDRQGVVTAMSGHAVGADGGCRWAYLDTRDRIGCYTEIYYVEGFAKTQQLAFRSGESDTMIPPSMLPQ